MAIVHIPAAMRSLTSGDAEVSAPGTTLGEVVANLDERFPGIQARMVDGDRIRPGLAVFLDGISAPSRLSTPVSEISDIYFAPAISGG